MTGENYLHNSDYKTLHNNQKVIYEEKGNPIGIIKFVDEEYIEDIIKNYTLYFPNVKCLSKKLEDVDVNNPRRDSNEGKYEIRKLSGKKYCVNVENILDKYFISSYSCSFTLLFEEDFDSNGNIKNETVKLLKNLENYNIHDGKGRPFLIANFDNFNVNIQKYYANTPIFTNPFKNNSYNISKDYLTIYGGIYQIIRSCEPYGEDKITKKAENLGEFSFHGGYIYYEDEYDAFSDEEKRMLEQMNENKIRNHSYCTDIAMKLIECCLNLKERKYENEREYRLLVSNFFNSKEKFKEFKGIKLTLYKKPNNVKHDANAKINFKKFEFTELNKINRKIVSMLR